MKRKPKPSRPNVHAKDRPASKAQRLRVLARDSYLCQACGDDCAARKARIEAALAELRADREWIRLRHEYRIEAVALRSGCLVEEVGDVMRRTEIAQVDHVVARVERGRSEDANLQTLCRRCHKAKSAADTSRAARLPTTRTTL